MKYVFCLCFFFYLNLFFILLCLKSSRREIFQIFSFHQTRKNETKNKTRNRIVITTAGIYPPFVSMNCVSFQNMYEPF